MMRSRLFAAAVVLVIAAPAHAYFEETAAGARGVALGSAALGVIDDASAYYWNPAALSAIKRYEVVADFAKPYGIPDLNVGTLAVAGRAYGTGWAVAWHRLAIGSAYSEDLFHLAAGRRVLETSKGHALSAGATYKLGRIGFAPFDNPDSGTELDLGSQAKGSVDLALKWTTPWRLDFSWVGRNLIEPTYQFVEGTGGDAAERRQEVAAALRWNRESVATVGWSQQELGPATFNAGIEILFYDVFSIRSGVSNLSEIYKSYGSPNDLQYNGGFGVFHKGYFVDVAATTNHDLGASYRVTLRLPFGSEARP